MILSLGLLTYRIVAVAVAVNGFFPFVHGIFGIQNDYVRTVGADLFRGDIVKLKNILDELVFLGVDDSLGVSFHEHHLDLFLGHLVVVLSRD